MSVELLLALEQATDEYEEWLASLVSYDEPHRSSGKGVPARYVAQVLAHGKTHNSRWKEQMTEAGISSFIQLPFQQARALADSFESFWETRSDLSRTVARLRKARAQGLIAYDSGESTWTATVEGAELLAEAETLI